MSLYFLISMHSDLLSARFFRQGRHLAPPPVHLKVLSPQQRLSPEAQILASQAVNPYDVGHNRGTRAMVYTLA